MDITNLLVSLGLPILTLIAGVWIARQKVPYENRASQSLSQKSDAEGDKTRAETITIQNQTIAGMVQQLATQNGTIFGMQNALNAQANEMNNLSAKVNGLDANNAALLAEVAAGHQREDELKTLTVQQRALIDGLPPRMDLLEAALLKEGVVLPRDPEVDAARAAIDKKSGAATADKALHVGDTVTLAPAASKEDDIPPGVTG